MPQINYTHAIQWLEKRGSEMFNTDFKISESEKEIVIKLLCYFLKDTSTANYYALNLNKGILLNGPIGCGKTTLMNLLRFYEQPLNRFFIKSCRDISFEFIQNGYEVIHKYSKLSFNASEPRVYCFDDLGTENNLKYFGNECNVMAEILLSRYDLFSSKKMITHLTTNLSASEIESFYGNRVRSRMREQFNLIAFDSKAQDKRK
jgi:DNA replication protein DnaC